MPPIAVSRRLSVHRFHEEQLEIIRRAQIARYPALRHCLFPPDAMDSSLQVLHKLGYTGPMWDLLLPGEKTRERKKHAAK